MKRENKKNPMKKAIIKRIHVMIFLYVRCAGGQSYRQEQAAAIETTVQTACTASI